MSSFSIKSCGLYKKPVKKTASSDDTGEFSYLFDEKAQEIKGPNPTDPKQGGHCIHVSNTPVISSGPNPNHPKHGGHCIHSSNSIFPDAH